MANKIKLTQELLKEYLSYDESTGIFVRLKKYSTYARCGGQVGDIANKDHCSSRGNYQRVAVLGSRFPAHKLAWLYVYGVYPDHELDHIDRNGLNNAIKNLRASNRSGNTANTIKKNELGVPGVRKQGSRYVARVKKDKVEYSLGSFATAEEAHEAYKKAHVRLHGEFSPYFGML